MDQVPSSKQVVSWEDYKRIDAEETRRGQQHVPPKLREKITSVPELLAVARGGK
jgi:hypothetical protein